MADPAASKGGRPSTFDHDLAVAICEDIASGESLRRSCKRRGIAPATAVRWFMTPELGVTEHYALARRIQAELMFDEILDITDDGSNDWMQRHGKDGESTGFAVNGEAVNRSRLRTDTRKWILARMDPKRYGDSSKLDLLTTISKTKRIILEDHAE